jgi:hypothetical protein
MARTVLVKGFGWGMDHVRCPRSTTWPEADDEHGPSGILLSISVTTVDCHQSPIAQRVRDFRLTGDRLRYDVTMPSFCFGQCWRPVAMRVGTWKQALLVGHGLGKLITNPLD